MFKVNDEIYGRGTAYFSLESIKILKEIFKNENNLTEKDVLKIREIVTNVKNILNINIINNKHYLIINNFLILKIVTANKTRNSASYPISKLHRIHTILFTLQWYHRSNAFLKT